MSGNVSSMHFESHGRSTEGTETLPDENPTNSVEEDGKVLDVVEIGVIKDSAPSSLSGLDG